MYKLFAAIVISAICMSPVVQCVEVVDSGSSSSSAGAAASASSSGVHTLHPAVMQRFGYQLGVPLLTPNVGPLTPLVAAALGPRNYVAQSNPILIRDLYADRFMGESKMAMLAI